MDKLLICELQSKVSLLSNCDNEEDKKKVRNELFIEMLPFIDRWLKSQLKTRNMFLDDCERLSLSWDCFEFCLNYYDPKKNIPLPNHFYAYTKFFLLINFSQGNNKKEYNYYYNEERSIESDRYDLEKFYEQLDELKQFRNTIPSDYKKIFDDAILSMAGKTGDKVAYEKSDAYTYYKYCEAKKVFKVVIDYLLLR